MLAALLAGSAFLCHGQKRNEQIEFRPLHLGIVNGIGTNGIYDLKHENNVSLNLFTGQSYGNNILCISGISHFQLLKSQGIYLSGIANVSGGYPFINRENQEDSLASLRAIQLSGLFNVVNGTGDGAQLAGLSNSVTESLDGFQFSTVYNFTGKGFSGFQLSLLTNRIGEYGVGVQAGLFANSSKNFTGVQFPAIINAVSNDLDGVQLGLFNYIGNKKSTVYRNFHFYWLQMGVINRAIQNSDGVQIGLFNLGKDIGLSQIGIINLSNKIPEFPIGILNIAADMEGFARASVNRIFPINVEIGTGSKRVMNIASYSRNPNRNIWALGYSIGNQVKGGIKKNQFFYEYFASIKQIKEENQSFLDPNFVYNAKFEFGFNPVIGHSNRPKMIHFFLFAGFSLNIHKVDDGERLSSGFLSDLKGSHERWVDFHFGIQF